MSLHTPHANHILRFIYVVLFVPIKVLFLEFNKHYYFMKKTILASIMMLSTGLFTFAQDLAPNSVKLKVKSSNGLFQYSYLPEYPEYSEYEEDRKSTRLNSSHVRISYAVFCLKKKNNKDRSQRHTG